MCLIFGESPQLQTADTRGDVYEYLLSKIATAGVNGQFRTPRHIIRMMVDLMQPKENDIDKKVLNRYDVLVSDTSTKGSDYYDILCKRYDS